MGKALQVESDGIEYCTCPCHTPGSSTSATPARSAGTDTSARAGGCEGAWQRGLRGLSKRLPAGRGEGAGAAANERRTALRRRLRFQRSPNLVQSEVPLAVKGRSTGCQRGVTGRSTGGQRPVNGWSNGGQVEGPEGTQEERSWGMWGEGDVRGIPRCCRVPQYSELVHKYLPPIVAGFPLISALLSSRLSAADAPQHAEAAEGVPVIATAPEHIEAAQGVSVKATTPKHIEAAQGVSVRPTSPECAWAAQRVSGAPKMVVLGGGACTLPIFLRRNFPHAIHVSGQYRTLVMSR